MFKPSFVMKDKYLDFRKLKNISCHLCPCPPTCLLFFPLEDRQNADLGSTF